MSILRHSATLGRRWLLGEHLVLVLCGVWFLAGALTIPGFATPENLQNVLAYLLPILVAAVGLTFVLITGGIDLSLTAIIATTSVLGAKLVSGPEAWLSGSGVAVVAAMAIMMVVGGLLGALNGVTVSCLRVPPFMATLVLMMVVGGFAIWWTQSRKIFGLPDAFTLVARNLGLEAGLVGVVLLLAHGVLSFTLLGHWLYAVGRNATAARISGVPVRWVVFWTYVVSGVFAGMSSILFTASLETGDPEMARTALLDIIGAVVIGGTSLYGGKGKVLWTVYGVVFLALIDNSLNMVGLKFYSIMMVKGAVILVAAILDSLRHGWDAGTDGGSA